MSSQAPFVRDVRRSIFIGGFGRSGTSILRQLLGSHSRIYALPLETRFIVDSDGLYDLYRNLTRDYSVVRGREALYRFERMMRIYMARPTASPYAGYDIASICGPEIYWRELDRLTNDLTAFEFESKDHSVNQASEPRLVTWARTLDRVQRRARGTDRPLPTAEIPRHRLRYAHFFPDEAELLSRLGEYVDSLFGAAADRHGKDVYCEKTPLNIMHAPFLLSMLPTAVFVHIIRDPRAVARSLMNQPWAPDSADACCGWVEDYHSRWSQLRDDPILGRGRYVELRFEDLTANPLPTLERVTTACGLDASFRELPVVRPEHTADWRTGLEPAEIQLIERRLAHVVEQLPCPRDSGSTHSEGAGELDS